MTNVLTTPHNRIRQPQANRIARLPAELTDDILHREITHVKDDWLALIKRREELAQVCLQWAITIDSTPRYWDTLAVHSFMNSKFISRSVERAKSRSLTIRIFLSAKGSQYPTKVLFTRPRSRDAADFIQNILPGMAVVFPRAQDLHLEAEEASDAVAVMNFLALCGLPSTRKANISSRWHSSLFHDATGDAIDMPQLSTLSLTLVHPLSFGTLPYNNLVALTIKCLWCTPALRATQFAQALAAATRLETLTLEEVQCVDVDGTAAVALPAVTDFNISYMQDRCAEIISRLEMPSLARMRAETRLGSTITSLFTSAPEVFIGPSRVVLCCNNLTVTEMRRTILLMKQVVSLDLGGCTFHTPDAFEELVLIPEFTCLRLEELRLPHDVPVSTIRAVLSVSREDIVLVPASQSRETQVGARAAGTSANATSATTSPTSTRIRKTSLSQTTEEFSEHPIHKFQSIARKIAIGDG
ncbi:hypothetical protein C8R43DRAFT_1133595 [Mycena crocata]|nr:hypothetical protein C8R43DRAFT_1133595 [Mycena crocata]